MGAFLALAVAILVFIRVAHSGERIKKEHKDNKQDEDSSIN